MGLFGKKSVEYFYLQKNTKGETHKYGPYGFDQFVMVYKELQIDSDTYMWTTEKCFEDGKGKPTRAPGWIQIKDMPEEFVERLEEAAMDAKDRRQKMNTGQVSASLAGRSSGAPPPVPIL